MVFYFAENLFFAQTSKRSICVRPKVVLYNNSSNNIIVNVSILPTVMKLSIPNMVCGNMPVIKNNIKDILNHKGDFIL